MAATVAGIHLTGNHAGRPASGVSTGTLYSCTTHGKIYQTTDTGSTWITWAPVVGAGTSNPSSPSTGDRFYRTDIGMEVTYDGTRWFTTQLFEGVVKDTSLNNVADPGGTASLGYFAPDPTYDMYLDRLISTLFVNGTNNGTNFWTIKIQKTTAANVTTDIASVTTASDTGSNWTTRGTSIGAVFSISAHKQLQFIALDTLSPGNLFWALRFTYRLIVT